MMSFGAVRWVRWPILTLAPAALVAQQPRIVRDTCPASCGVRAVEVARIKGTDEEPLRGPPFWIAGDASGRMFVVQTDQNVLPVAPVLVFDSVGRPTGTLGPRRGGRGPGELHRPFAVLTEWDDSVRVLDQGRLITFTRRLIHVRTAVMAARVTYPTRAAAVRADAVMAIGSEYVGPNVPDGIRQLVVGLTPAQPIPAERLPSTAGPHRVLAAVRAPYSGQAWVAQFAVQRGTGFDFFRIDPRGLVGEVWRRTPGDWASADVMDRSSVKLGPPSSRVRDIRELPDSVLSVLIAEPRRGWEDVELDPRTMAGWWNRYQTKVEVLDLKSGSVRAQVRVRGYPMRMLSDSRIVTYVEEDDEPMLLVFALRSLP